MPRLQSAEGKDEARRPDPRRGPEEPGGDPTAVTAPYPAPCLLPPLRHPLAPTHYLALYPLRHTLYHDIRLDPRRIVVKSRSWSVLKNYPICRSLSYFSNFYVSSSGSEMDMTKERIAKIIAAGANVVLTTGGIDDLCLKYFVESGAMAVRRCKKADLRRIAKATGGGSPPNLIRPSLPAPQHGPSPGRDGRQALQEGGAAAHRQGNRRWVTP